MPPSLSSPFRDQLSDCKVSHKRIATADCHWAPHMSGLRAKCFTGVIHSLSAELENSRASNTKGRSWACLGNESPPHCVSLEKMQPGPCSWPPRQADLTLSTVGLDLRLHIQAHHRANCRVRAPGSGTDGPLPGLEGVESGSQRAGGRRVKNTLN